MNFWKTILSTILIFISITSVVVYTACEKDACQNVNCKNGGSCKGGACVCPTNYEGPTCENKVITRYLGYYAGYTGCNSGAQVIDTVFITENNPKVPNSVMIIQHTHKLDTLYGTVSSNEATYSVTIPDKIATRYSKGYHIALQADKNLTLYTYERDQRTPGDSIVTQCNFVGVKKTAQR